MDNPFKSPTILSLCTGMCGLERGLERAGVKPRTLAFLEIEAFIIQNLVAQMESGLLDPAPIWSNLKTFPVEGFRNKVHGIIGGYPCQPFSNAGKRAGANDPRHLWPYIKEMVRSIAPDWCFFENVAGHLSLGFDIVKRELEELHYRVEAGIFSAEEVGAPHRRERLFILATKLGNPEYDGLSSAAARRSAFQASDKPEEGSIYAGESTGTSRSKFGPDLQSSEREEILADAKSKLRQQSGGTRTRGARSSDSGSRELGDPIIEQNNGIRRDSELGRNRMGRDPETTFKDNRQTDTNGIDRSSDELGHPNKPGLQGRDSEISEERTGERFAWPTGPSKQQGEWEPPRIESSLGFTVNGYNFREDLLRMAGNGVVEQTAEIAFRELLKKHATTKP